MAFLRRSLTALLTSLLLTGALPSVSAPAYADTGYRYWGYFHWAGADGWQFADTGPADYTPEDGSVEGFRFAVHVGKTPREPRTDGDFASICADTPAEDDQKRVAVVIDYGLPEDAPDGDETPAARGACAVVPTDATGAQVLQAVAQVRIGQNGLTCGIDGYPAGECGPEVKGVSVPAADEPVELQLPAAGAADADGDFPWAPVGVAVLALGIGAAAALTLRRRARPGD